MLYQGVLFVASCTVDDEGKVSANGSVTISDNGTYRLNGDCQKVPTPQTYGWSKEDLDSEEGTGRNNADGEMFRDRVSTKRKLSFTWPPLSISETSRLLKAISPEEKGKEFISVTYLDAYEGEYLTKTFYAGPQSANCGHHSRWLGITANLIEK